MLRDAAQTPSQRVPRSEGRTSFGDIPRGEPKIADLQTTGQVIVTLFFDSKFTVQKGEQLRLSISDADTGEQFPRPDGILLTASRNL